MTVYDRDTLIGRRDSLQRQLKDQRRRLWKLEEQRARYGISTPPNIAIEIEDQTEAIKGLEAELAEIEQQLAKSAAPIETPLPPKAVQPTVFISYSREDEAEKDELVSHLGVLQGSGLLEIWVDDQIEPGGDWAKDINQAINRAQVAILLITRNFLNSNFNLKTELPHLLKRRQSEGVTVFPIIARPCAWRKVDWLARMSVRPKNGNPIWREGGRYVDEELAAIAEEVADIIERAS
jgi:hypothetical protein